VWLATAAHHDEVAAEASVDQIFDVGYLQRDFVRAERAIRHARAFVDRLGGHDLLRARMENNVAAVLDTRGNQREAIARYRAALAIRERVLGPKHPDVATSLTSLGRTLCEMNRPEEALPIFNRAIDITAEALGPQHVDMALQLAGRAETLNLLGRYAAAVRNAERALGIYEKAIGTDNPELEFILQLLGESQLGLGRPDLAIPPLERALEMNNDFVNPGMGFEKRRIALSLARALWASGGDRERAQRLAEMAAQPSHPTEDAHPARARALIQAANAWLAAHGTTVPERG